jgi:hypothetical protein
MAAEFDCFLASGIETGGEGSLLKTHLPQALIRKPFAYRPPRKINRVDVETKLARLTPTNNRALYCFFHLRTGNLGYYRNISLNARIIFASYKSFSQFPQMFVSLAATAFGAVGITKGSCDSNPLD